MLDNTSSTELEDKYFSELTSEQMIQLYQTYKYDFELFQYDIERFLKLKLQKH